MIWKAEFCGLWKTSWKKNKEKNMGFLMVSDIIKMAERQLQDAGIETYKNDAEALYCYLKHLNRARFFMQWSDNADDLTCENYFNLVARRAAHEPLQLIIGEESFMGLSFGVREGVLIPRMDTEVVALAAELLLKEKKNKTVLDLCCGSGILGISLAKRAEAKPTFVDISKEAVELTKENLVRNQVRGADVCQGDLFEPIGRKKYGMIVSNPPYIPSNVIPTLMPEVKDYDPLAALDGGEDGLEFYRRIVEEAPEHLKKDGVLVLEIGSDQAYPVTRMLEESPAFYEIQVLKDLAGLDRVVTAQFDERAAKGKPSKKQKAPKGEVAQESPEEVALPEEGPAPAVEA